MFKPVFRSARPHKKAEPQSGKRKHEPQDDHDQDDQDQDQRRRLTPIFGSARPRKKDKDEDQEEVVLLDWSGLRKKGIRYHPTYLRKMWEANPPRFPKPRHLSPRKLVWTSQQIDAWIAAKLEAVSDGA